MIRRVAFYVGPTDRILIVGMPRSGKMPLAQDLADKYGLPILHTDHLEGEWSEVSEQASRWFDEPGGFIGVGVAVPRALRKWIRRNPKLPRPYSISVGMWEPRQELSDAQLRMGRQSEAVWRECQEHFADLGLEPLAEQLEALAASFPTVNGKGARVGA